MKPYNLIWTTTRDIAQGTILAKKYNFTYRTFGVLLAAHKYVYIAIECCSTNVMMNFNKPVPERGNKLRSLVGLVNTISRCLSHVKGPASNKKGNRVNRGKVFYINRSPYRKAFDWLWSRCSSNLSPWTRWILLDISGRTLITLNQQSKICASIDSYKMPKSINCWK